MRWLYKLLKILDKHQVCFCIAISIITTVLTRVLLGW